MRIEDLHKRWDERTTKHAIVPEMMFAGGFLVLGAGTRLAKVGAAVDRVRLVARLAAAHRRPIETSSMRHIERALAARQRGETALAYTHIALSQLAKLAHPRDDARWLFSINTLLQGGADPLTIVKGLGIDPAACGVSLGKYSPDQPRVSAGNPDGGQWTSDSTDSDAGVSQAPQPKGVQVADASTSRGNEVMSDALPASISQQETRPPITEVADQSRFHDTLRDHFAEVLRQAGNAVLIEIPLLLPGEPPVGARIDIFGRNARGELFGIDVKTGVNPGFTLQQQIVYPHVEAGDIVIAPDPRMPELGIVPGARLPHADLLVLYASGPGAKLEVRPMLQYMRP